MSSTALRMAAFPWTGAALDTSSCACSELKRRDRRMSPLLNDTSQECLSSTGTPGLTTESPQAVKARVTPIVQRRRLSAACRAFVAESRGRVAATDAVGLSESL